MQTPPQRTGAGTRRQLAAVALAVCAAFAAPALRAAEEKVVLPDGTAFPFWDDRTDYRKTYHVACQDPQASDANPGTRGKPLRTIGRAAEVLQPGEKVVVHEGVYSCGKVAEICVPVARLGESAPAAGPGPFDARQWKFLREGKPITY